MDNNEFLEYIRSFYNLSMVTMIIQNAFIGIIVIRWLYKKYKKWDGEW